MQPNKSVNRRTAGQMILSAAAVASLTPLAPPAFGAQPFGKDKDKKDDKKKNSRDAKAAAPTIDMSKLLVPDKRHDWTLTGEINVNAWVQSPQAKNEQYTIHEFTFDSAAVVFPVLRGSASHRTYDGELKSKLQFDEALISEAPSELVDTFPCGTRLGRWDMKSPDGKKFRGRSLKLEVDISMTSWRTVFDEEMANAVPWPTGRWGKVAATTFSDLQRVGRINLVDHTTEGIQSLVRQWCDNKDPKTIPPVPLAKWLASNVLEYIQPSGSGLSFADNGMLEGMDLQGSEQTLAGQRGSDQDITCALAAVYRAAGLPARTVIGFDVLDDKGGKDSFLKKRRRDVPGFRSWVEFCLYDERTRKEVWIPVDITRQRSKSSKILRNLKSWQFFGQNDELDSVCPFAFQFHPPTTVIAHGSVAFWGWITFGAEQPKGVQYLRFNAMTTPKKKSTESDRQKFDEQQRQPQPASRPPEPRRK